MRCALKGKDGCTNVPPLPVTSRNFPPLPSDSCHFPPLPATSCRFPSEPCKTEDHDIEAESSEDVQIARIEQGNHDGIQSKLDKEALHSTVSAKNPDERELQRSGSDKELQEAEAHEEMQETSMLQSETQETNMLQAERAENGMEDISFRPGETLIVFDWDDTIMPTFWLQSNKLCDRHALLKFTPEQKSALEGVANQAAKLLEAAGNLGEVVIVTSAETGWVEYSCRLFLAKLLPSLDTVRIVSARSLYESQYPKDAKDASRDWKIKAFQAEAVRKFDNEGRRNILSIGDSPAEKAALEHIRQFWSTRRGSYAKSVQLLLKPMVDQLHQQLLLLTQQMTNLVQCKDNLTLHIGDDPSLD